ncbi:ABC1 kinase family protein [Lentibacillus halodurans]|uniref:ABC1 kinase family protein n=1 Tax=Lentibacillus halodurans TaxID=237679 RepID=UPI003CC7A78F
MLGLGGSLKYNSIYRCTMIIWMTIKFIVQIYFFHIRHSIWDHRTREKWNILVAGQAKEYRTKAAEMGGVMIKAGQFLSTRTDFMPDVFIKELSRLVDQVPPMTFDYATNLLEEEWGTSVHTYLRTMDKSSVASASIGEVYRGILKDGSPVAIKVQRYRIEDIFHMDFIALKIVFRIISIFTSFGKKADLHGLYQELIDVMDKELDFEQERIYGKYFKNRYKDNQAVYIPAYYDRLCTKKVLVMEWVDGAKITDFDFIQQHNIEPGELAKTLFDFYFDQFLNQGYFHADPHAGNILVQEDGTISIIDFGMVSDIRKKDTQYFRRLFQGMIMDDYDTVLQTLDEMNFILPNANRKKLKAMIQETIDLYENGAFQQMDAQLMDQLKEDIRIFVKEQPIQLSADYAYLGRAISIILGILIHIYPDMDLEKWVKPKVKQWFGGKKLTDSVYAELAKEAAKPFLSFPRAMLSWLENGEKDRQWEKEQRQIKQMHQFYLLVESALFIILLVNIGIFVYIRDFYTVGGTITGLLLLSFLVVLFKHYRFIQ